MLIVYYVFQLCIICRMESEALCSILFYRWLQRTAIGFALYQASPFYDDQAYEQPLIFFLIFYLSYV